MLLLWATLKPDGPSSNLAAVRFASPVRVRSLRIFPNGAIPFKQQPDIVAETTPTSFYLDVYFNAQHISLDGKTKQKPTNALVQTSIAYQGGAVEFGVGQERSEHATRLLIIRGKFEKLSVAIYGEAVVEADTLAPSKIYQSTQLPSISTPSIPLALDPGSSVDPTLLAQSLMTLVPDEQRPSLPLIIRLMFCLKPPNEAWDEPGFPHIYADLEQDMFDLNLERAFEMIARPVSDNIEENILRNFAASLADSITDYNDEEAYFLAKVMARCAPQHSSLLQLILEHIDLVRMYTEANLDRWTLIYLTDAAASVDVARQLNNDQTIDILQEIVNDPTCDERRRKAASTLLERIKAWDVFEDALINTQAPFLDAATFVRDITGEENSFGIWLENMIGHKDMLERLHDIGQLRAVVHPLTLWQSNATQIPDVSHDDFIRFVRMCIGAACVVAVYAWADSTSVEECKERTLAVIKFWQNVEGYRQVVDHFMVMRQMIYRLDSMLPMDDDLPSQAGVDAEYILQTISREPEAMLRPDLVEVVRKLPMPLNYICDSELSDLKEISSLAKGGLSEAFRLLAIQKEFDSKSLMKLRVAVAVITDALANGRERELSEELWAKGSGSLPSQLIRVLVCLDDALQLVFGVSPPLTHKQGDPQQIFQTCDELLSLMQRLQVARTEPTRDVVALTKALADIAVASDIAPDLFRHGNTSAIVLSTRQRCVSILRDIVQPTSIDAQTVASARAGLGALFTGVKNDVKLNRAHFSAQLFWLIDEILPDLHMDDWDESQEEWLGIWASQLIPELLSDIDTFFDTQDNDNKLNFIKHLKRIDIIDTAVTDWLIIQELGRLERAVDTLSNVDFVLLRITHWRISTSLDFIVSVIQDSSTAQWATMTLMTGKCLDAFAHTFRRLCASRLCFEQMVTLAKNISIWNVGDTQLKSLLMHIFLRAICCGLFECFNSLTNVLQDTAYSLFNEEVAEEFGEALEHLASSIGTLQLEKDLPFLVFRVLEQVTPMDRSSGVFVFASMTKGALTKIISWLDETLQVAEQTKLQAMKLRWSVSGKPRNIPVLIPRDYTLDLSLGEWESALVPPAPAPSTPKRKSPAQSAEMLGMITVSPPNALLRSPEVKGLTKIYSKNDFRQLRQAAGARQNTSRMPSRHVDDFEQGAPATLSVPGSPTASFTPQTQRPAPLDLSLPMKPTTFFQ